MPAQLARLEPVAWHQVSFSDAFWAPRVETNRRVTLPIQYGHLEKTGRLAALDPHYRPGDRSSRHIFWDSDVAKWMEAAAYSLATHPDQELAERLEAVIASFGRLQAPDGYLNSWFLCVEPEKRWTNLRDHHELYCAGHLMEAAVAHYQATGRRNFLEILCRYADHIDRTFGREEGKRRGYCGHEEVELALVKLYRATGEPRYLRLAQYFIDERGQQPHYFDLEARERGEDPARWYFRSYRYNQSHKPVREQEEVVGHAVRAMYLYCGMADVARETGDVTLVAALDRLWRDLVEKKLYVTGGIGSAAHNEGFTAPYDLPDETAYCETCAAIGFVFWNHRLLHLHGHGRYADALERSLYNGVLSGVSLSGDRFFYVNPLASTGQHHRQDWFGCACCPPNIARLLASLGQFVYSTAPGEAWVHLYAAGEGRLAVDGREVLVRQETRYPWEGRVAVTLRMAAPARFTLAIRIPGWCRRAELAVNGRPVELEAVLRDGYARLEREWRDGDTVVLELAMPVERVYAHPAVRMTNGRVALQRGPIVYCLEEADNPVVPLTRVVLPREAPLTARYQPELLGGVVVVEAEGQAVQLPASDQLYTTEPPRLAPVRLRAVPYAVWDNRTPGQMLVWLREA